MRVAILSPVAWRTPPRHYGPWEQVASNVAEGLVREGFDVTLFATGNSMTKAKLEAVIPVGYEEVNHQDAKVSECLHISNLMEQAARFDIIHNHFDFLPLTYSKLIATPMVTTIHGFSSKLIIPVYKKYNDSCHYVSISYADRSPELKYIANVYHGIDGANFTFSNSAQDYLLFLGRIHSDKGTAEAIEIAKKAKRRLLIAGIVQEQSYFKEKVEPFLDENIAFLGHAEAKKRNELLSNAYALLHPIRFDEPFGLSVAEAMYCGTPVIAFNKGSMPELILDKVTGFLVNSVGEAVDAINCISTISRLACHKHASSRFSIDKMISDYVNVYNQVLTS